MISEVSAAQLLSDLFEGKSATGYKIMTYVSATKKLQSMADDRTSIPFRKGYILGSPTGIWLGSTKEYVQNYYGSGFEQEPEEMPEGRYEMLLTFQYVLDDVMEGDPEGKPSLQDAGVEFSVKKATLTHAYNVTDSKEEF
jgi:hypothetical protein